MRLWGFSHGRFRVRQSMFSTAACALLALSTCPLLALANGKTAADYYVHSLPGAPDGPLLKMHAGHIDVDESHNAKLFFWHYQNRHIANKQRTVIWLNGGPGCSSEDGGLMEIGPYRLKDDSTLIYNDGSWDEFANLMFVDNPVGTGFSSVDTDSYIHDLPEMASHFIKFLDRFFEIFPQYEQDDIYLAGESYAGQHIPYIAKAILDRNKAGPTNTWNLKGMLIGNGWISPQDQYPSYMAFAYEKGLVAKDSDVANELEALQAVCFNRLREEGAKDRVDLDECEEILKEMLRLTQTRAPDGTSQCYNVYDVRLKDEYSSCGMNWPPDLEFVTPYLRKPDVVKALHIEANQIPGWTECNGQVGSAFSARNSLPSIQLLPALLEEVPTVLFSGAEDLICNHLGTEDLINNMLWNGGKGFELAPGTWAPRRDWTFEGEAAGIYQEARNLTYVLFYNASHMVPFDYSRRTRDMLDRFMGVDIASIGGVPADSRIDGEKAGPATSVGGHPNSTAAETAEKGKIDAAKWHAYYRSGEVALVVVIILTLIWGFFVYRDRRRRSGYIGVNSGGGRRPLALGLEGPNSFRSKHMRSGAAGRDVEAADFDEGELDDLHLVSPREETGRDSRRYSVGSLSDEEDSGRGHAVRK